MSEPNELVPPPIDAGADVVIEAIKGQLEAQPWYRTFSNTVTSGIGAILTVLWVAGSHGLDVPPQVTVGVYTVLALAVVFGVYKTKNGVSPSQVEALEKWSRDRLKLDG